MYDSDDEETHSILKRISPGWYPSKYVLEMCPCSASDLSGAGSVVDFGGVNGWTLEVVCVEEVRIFENGGWVISV